MPQIAKRIRTGIYNRLSDVSTGFNPNLASVASAYGITAFSIDFSASSKNFYFGRISPDIVENVSPVTDIASASSILAYALLTIDSLYDRDTALVTSATFAGDVQGVIEITLSWEASQLPQNLPDWIDACEDSIYTAMSSPTNQGSWTSSGLIYDRKMQMLRGPISLAGANIRQTIQFQPMFRLIAP